MAAQWARGSALNNNNNNNVPATGARLLKGKGQPPTASTGSFPSSSLPQGGLSQQQQQQQQQQPLLATKKNPKQLGKDGPDINPNPGPGAGPSESNQLNLTPKQQAAIAKKASKLLLREQLKAAGVPFPDDPSPGTHTINTGTHTIQYMYTHD